MLVDQAQFQPTKFNWIGSPVRETSVGTVFATASDVRSLEDAMRKELLFQLAQGAAEAGELQKAIEVGMELANVDFAYNDIGRLLDEWQTRVHA